MSEEIKRGDTELLGANGSAEETKIETETPVIKKKKSKLPFIIVGTVLLIGIAVFIAFMVANAKPERKVARELELARQYLDEMNYEMAIASYTKAIEIDPKNVKAYEGLANTYVAMAEKEIIVGNMDLAIEYYENAITVLEQGEAETGDEGLAELLVSVQEKKQETEQQNQTADETDNVHENIVNDNEAEGEKTEGFNCMTAEEIIQASVGEVVTYGCYSITGRSYEEDANNHFIETGVFSEQEAPIEWIVIVNDDEGVTLLSKNVLDEKPYNSEQKPVTWESSEIRAWLNGDFYNIAFSKTERDHIQAVTCKNEDNPYFGAVGGNGIWELEEEEYPAGGTDTLDYVWLMSLAEIEQYFGVNTDDWSRFITDELDSEAYGALCSEKSDDLLKSKDWWWLRSPGSASFCAAFVGDIGDVHMGGSGVDVPRGVRPVIRVGL